MFCIILIWFTVKGFHQFISHPARIIFFNDGDKTPKKIKSGRDAMLASPLAEIMQQSKEGLYNGNKMETNGKLKKIKCTLQSMTFKGLANKGKPVQGFGVCDNDVIMM